MINYLSDCADCGEMARFLAGEGNDNLVIYYHEVGPITTLRYKGYHFFLKYNKDKFARLTQSNIIGVVDENYANILYELGEMVSKMIGNPTVYYDMHFNEAGKERINPTLEWCLDMETVDEYVGAIVNNTLYDDNTKCENIKLLNGRNIEDYQKSKQLVLNK